MNRRTRTALVALIGITLLAAAVVGGVALARFQFGPLIWDEWVCAEGEAPALKNGGGSACFAEDAELPEGWAWDPLGNRPFSCDHRRGWTAIEDLQTQETDCLADGLALPEGWAIKQN